MLSNDLKHTWKSGPVYRVEAVERWPSGTHTALFPLLASVSKWPNGGTVTGQLSPVWIWHLGTMLLLQSLSDFRWHRIREMGGRSRASLATMPLALLAHVCTLVGNGRTGAFLSLAQLLHMQIPCYVLDWIKPCTFYLFELDRKRCIKF